MQSFAKTVQIGRVAHIAKGKDAGQLAAIVDVVDANRVSDRELLLMIKVGCKHDDPNCDRKCRLNYTCRTIRTDSFAGRFVLILALLDC